MAAHRFDILFFGFIFALCFGAGRAHAQTTACKQAYSKSSFSPKGKYILPVNETSVQLVFDLFLNAQKRLGPESERETSPEQLKKSLLQYHELIIWNHPQSDRPAGFIALRQTAFGKKIGWVVGATLRENVLILKEMLSLLKLPGYYDEVAYDVASAFSKNSDIPVVPYAIAKKVIDYTEIRQPTADEIKSALETKAIPPVPAYIENSYVKSSGPILKNSDVLKVLVGSPNIQ